MPPDIARKAENHLPLAGPVASVLSWAPAEGKFAIVIIWDAIAQMRERSGRGESFSFAFMSCNRTEGSSEGIVEVRHGRLLSREDTRHHKDADIVERYINLDTMQVRHFYQPLLMIYNGEKIQMI